MEISKALQKEDNPVHTITAVASGLHNQNSTLAGQN